MNELTSATIVALTKVISKDLLKSTKKSLSVGTHVIDAFVHVKGTLKKGEDYPQKIVAKADPWTLLAAALSHLNGVTVDSIVKEALTSDPELIKSLKERAAVAIQKLKKSTETDCVGKVTGKVFVEAM